MTLFLGIESEKSFDPAESECQDKNSAKQDENGAKSGIEQKDQDLENANEEGKTIN